MSATPELLAKLEGIASEINAKWDEGMRAGKLLAALEGRVDRYRPDVTEVRAALANYDALIAAIEAIRKEARKTRPSPDEIHWRATQALTLARREPA